VSAGEQTSGGGDYGAGEAVERGARRAALWDGLTAFLALVGLLDSVYLTVEHLSGRSVRCVVVSGCDEVLSSPYATLPGDVPLAALGALAYFAVFSLATLSAFGYPKARTPLAPLVALMFAATLWLFYLQAFVIRAFCTYCLVSAAVTTALALVVLGRKFFGARRTYS
jgi:uncharacterized membrane protein